MTVQIHRDALRIGHNLRVTFHRTLRIPDDGNRYPLPPSLGTFPIHRIEDFRSAVPDTWKQHGGVFMPLWQREALWLSFSGTTPHVAVKVAVGKVNALSGAPWEPALRADTQDYLVAPKQPWLDGINAGDGFIKQFVAMPLGQGYTVEGQVTGEETHGGLQLVVFDPKPGRFPDEPPHRPSVRARGGVMAPACAPAGAMAAEMGLAAGGRMRQQLYPDPHGLDTWDEANFGRVYVHIANSEAWTRITGEPLPPTPVDVRAYMAAGLPWFDLYDDHLGDIEASAVLAGVKSVDELDAQHVADGVW